MSGGKIGRKSFVAIENDDARRIIEAEIFIETEIFND